MAFAATAARLAPPRSTDNRILLHDVTWAQFESILAIRGDRATPRIAYLEGELELMSPSRDHEGIHRLLSRLLEAYAEETGLDLNSFGSWTLRSAPGERGIEPDSCYVLGDREAERPDLAIEVVWTHGGLDKLAIYQGLGVPEVWWWEDGRREARVLHEAGYESSARSSLMPDLDIALLASFLGQTNQTAAVRAYRAVLRAR